MKVRILHITVIETEFLPYFAEHQNYVYYCDIKCLLSEIGLDTYNANEWRLFIDVNKFGSIPVAHSITLKERYENVELILELIKYDQHKWIICVDLKMVCFLLGQ